MNPHSCRFRLKLHNFVLTLKGLFIVRDDKRQHTERGRDSRSHKMGDSELFNNLRGLFRKFTGGLRSTGVISPERACVLNRADNCARENKNRFIVMWAAFLILKGYFTSISFHFPIAGHTKGANDRNFGIWTNVYQRGDLTSMKQACTSLCLGSPRYTTSSSLRKNPKMEQSNRFTCNGKTCPQKNGKEGGRSSRNAETPQKT